MPEPPPLGLDLTSGAIRTIVWATGFRPDYSWLDVPVLDRKGMVRHDGGVVESPGMYLIGAAVPAPAQVEPHRRGRDDAEDLVVELAAYLDRQAAPGTRLIAQGHGERVQPAQHEAVAVAPLSSSRGHGQAKVREPWSNEPSATLASSRARGAPRQKWMPCPKPRWARVGRPMSRTSGSG